MIENLNNYHIFHTVAKCGNISKAASMLYISQPAISKSISRLESELETELFYRGSRGVTLTEEGQMLFSYIDKALESISRGEDNIKSYNELGVGHIRIGVSTSLCKHILLDYLKDFIKDNPNVKLSIDCHSTLNTIKLLREEKIDVGLICETELPKGIIYHPIKKIHDIFVASNDYIDNFSANGGDIFMNEDMYHPLITGNVGGLIYNGHGSPRDALHAGTVSAGDISSDNTSVDINSPSNKYTDSEDLSKDLHDHSTREMLEKANLMMLEEGNVTRTHVDSYLASQSISCSQLLEVNNMDLLIDFASIGMGVASVVKEFAAEQLASGDIIELPLSPAIPERTVGFAYNESAGKSKATKKFLAHVM
jgi:DNA-binding transcriptional LysR family regulator